MKENIFSILNTNEGVVIVANDKLEGNPIITPMLDGNGNPKTDLNGEELGTLRLEQTSTSLSGSFLNARRRVAFLTGTLSQLNHLVSSYNLKAGSKLTGKIVQIESLTPMWKNQTPKMNPQTAEEVGVTVNGTLYPVYMQQRYSEDSNAQDVLIRSVEDVNAWLNNQKALNNISAAMENATVPQN